MSSALKLYNSATALSEAQTLLEVKNVANKATVIKELARVAQDHVVEVQAAELNIRATRELGTWLAGMDLHKGGRPSAKTESDCETVSGPTLKELKIKTKVSAKAQKLAALPIGQEKKNRPFKPNPVLWRQMSHLDFQPFFDEIGDDFLEKLSSEQKRWRYTQLSKELSPVRTADRASNGAPRNLTQDLNRDIGATW